MSAIQKYKQEAAALAKENAELKAAAESDKIRIAWLTLLVTANINEYALIADQFEKLEPEEMARLKDKDTRNNAIMLLRKHGLTVL